jgi:peptidoglycan-associated lipoprotein
MRHEARYLAGGVLLILALCLVACSSGPKAQAPPPSPTPESAVEAEDTDVVEEQVKEPVTETLSSEVVSSELPEDLAVLNARGYLEDVFFDTDRFDLTPEARGILAKNASWMVQYSTVQILVEGHCDERNTREYNLALGERRANAVRDYLRSLGVDSARVRTISYGEERPFALGRSEESWRLNRRAHFVITGR